MEIKRCYETIIGASVAENQLVQSGATSVTVQSGHKYYAKINGTESLGASTGSAITINDSAKDMVVDLTQMLGSAIADYTYSLETATAGAGIAKLREWGFLKGYQAYNAGSLESVEVTDKVVRGFNQWDEQWEAGLIAVTTGEPTTGTGIRSKNFCRCVPSTQYYMKTGDSASKYIFWYDADKNFISHNSSLSLSTSPSNAAYFKIRHDGSNTYNHDICINLSSDRNGEYEAYAEQTYDYGDDTLRGIFKLDANNNLYADGDRKTSDGTVTRKRGRVVFDGSEGWFIISGSINGTCFALNTSVPFAGWGEGGYETALSNMFDKASVGGSTEREPVNTFWWNNLRTAYRVVWGTTTTTLAEFKAYLNEHNLVIEGELATPTTETSTPFTSPQIVYPDGTEEYVTSNGVPVGHETKYQL